MRGAHGRRTGFVEVDGAQLEFAMTADGGHSGPTLVLLHEGLGSVSTWRDWPERLSAATGMPCIAYSRAGYGRSSPETEPRSASFMHEEAVRTLPCVLDKLSLDEVILIGHSDGGSIALIYLSHPEAHGDARALGAVTISAHVFNEERCLDGIERAREAFIEGSLAAALARHHHAQTETAFWGWYGIWTAPAFRDWSIAPELSHISVPCLAIQGLDDPYGSPSQVRALMRQIGPGAKAMLLAECEHTAQREREALTTTLVSRFAREVSGR